MYVQKLQFLLLTLYNMNGNTIVKAAKYLFGTLFSAGTLCLLGAAITRKFWFAEAGFYVLTLGFWSSMLALTLLLSISVIYPKWSSYCGTAGLIILLNIPFAMFYSIIGVTLV